MLVRKVGTDYPVKRRFVPEERSTQPHYWRILKIKIKNRQTADRLTLGFHDAHFLPHYIPLPSYFFYFILPLTLYFLCKFSHSRYVNCTCTVQHFPTRQFLPQSSLATSTLNFILYSLSPDTSNNTWLHPHCVNIKDGFLHSFLR